MRKREMVSSSKQRSLGAGICTRDQSEPLVRRRETDGRVSSPFRGLSMQNIILNSSCVVHSKTSIGGQARGSSLS